MLLRLLAVVVVAFAAAAPVRATPFLLQRLAADPPPATVLAMAADARLEHVKGGGIYEREVGRPAWYRLTAVRDVPPGAHPKIVVSTPYLLRIQAWVPGDEQPTRHALYGPDADFRYSTRALVIDLPQGLSRGQSVWLRVDPRVVMPAAVSIEPLEDVHRADLFHVAWRSAILTVLVVLTAVALGFWFGVGERTYAWFAAMLLGALVYQAGTGGEMRVVPLVGDFFSGSPLLANLAAAVGHICSNIFMIHFLGLRTHMPRLRLALLGSGVVAAGVALGMIAFHPTWGREVGNLALVFSSLLTLYAGLVLAVRGLRVARILLVSWIPLIVTVCLRAVELSTDWHGPPWTSHALAASYSFTAILLTVGLADRMQQIRRERDDMGRRASTDSLTGVLSRQAVEARLADEVAAARQSGRPLSVVFFDIDHFKLINDRHGHRIGDECLRIVAMRARNRLRDQDSLGRYGGDEMVVVLPDTQLEEAVTVADGLRATVACRPFSIDGVLLPATLSLGVAQWHPGESAEALLERSDGALYASKAAGRNRASVAPNPVHDAMELHPS